MNQTIVPNPILHLKTLRGKTCKCCKNGYFSSDNESKIYLIKQSNIIRLSLFFSNTTNNISFGVLHWDISPWYFMLPNQIQYYETLHLFLVSICSWTLLGKMCNWPLPHFILNIIYSWSSIKSNREHKVSGQLKDSQWSFLAKLNIIYVDQIRKIYIQIKKKKHL